MDQVTTDAFLEQRNQLWDDIDRLLATRRLAAVRQARQLLRDWMRNYPDDYYSQDGGEEVAMMEDALELSESEKTGVPVAA